MQQQNDLQIKIQNQLVFWLANELSLDLATIDKKSTFSIFGLDSIKMVEMLNAIEKLTGLTIPQHVVQDYSSIETLALYLASPGFKNETTCGDKLTVRLKNESSDIVIPELCFE